MTITARVHWEAGGIADVLSYGFDQTMVYRCATIDGTYAEITGIGTRVVLVADQEEYYYDDATCPADTYYYKVRHLDTGTSLQSELSNPIGFIDVSYSTITSQIVKAAYLSPDDLQAQWEDCEPDAIRWTYDSLKNNGNRPYVIGTDWKLAIALCYTDETTALQEGHLLTGSAISVNITDELGTAIVSKSIGSGITLRSQGVARSLGGTMGEFVLAFTNSESTYTPGYYHIDGVVTFADTEKALHFRGEFEMRQSI